MIGLWAAKSKMPPSTRTVCSLQTWRTHMVWCQYRALVLNVQQKTWGDKHSLWRCRDGYFLVTTSKWMFRSFPQCARRTFCHFTVQWEIQKTVPWHSNSCSQDPLEPKGTCSVPGRPLQKSIHECERHISEAVSKINVVLMIHHFPLDTFRSSAHCLQAVMFLIVLHDELIILNNFREPGRCLHSHTPRQAQTP